MENEWSWENRRVDEFKQQGWELYKKTKECRELEEGKFGEVMFDYAVQHLPAQRTRKFSEYRDKLKKYDWYTGPFKYRNMKGDSK